MIELGYSGTISSLEKGVVRFAAYLRKLGFSVEVDVLKGFSSCPIHGYNSNVEITISKGEAYIYEKIYANGYGDDIKSMKDIKQVILSKIECEQQKLMAK